MSIFIHVFIVLFVFKFLIGTCYEENFIATGFGAYLAIPLIREKWNPRMSEGEARQLLEDCLRVLFYRYHFLIQKYIIEVTYCVFNLTEIVVRLIESK